MMSITKMMSTPEKIVKEIADIAILYRDYGVMVFISATICRRGKFINGKVKRVNFLLKQICEGKRYFFVVIVTLKSETYGRMVYIY